MSVPGRLYLIKSRNVSWYSGVPSAQYSTEMPPPALLASDSMNLQIVDKILFVPVTSPFFIGPTASTVSVTLCISRMFHG